MLKDKLKHILPSHSELNKITSQLDLKKLRSAYAALERYKLSVYEANTGLCAFHPSLASSVYDSFTQIPLSVQPESLSIDTLENQNRLPSSAISSYRKNKTLLSDSKYDEHTFNLPASYAVGTYFETVSKMFSSKVTRSRITILNEGKSIPYHIDYDPSYAVRVIIPIYSSNKVESLFVVRGVEETNYLEEGKAYFLNTGIPHCVMNRSDRARVALMYSIEGTEDLKDAGLL